MSLKPTATASRSPSTRALFAGQSPAYAGTRTRERNADDMLLDFVAVVQKLIPEATDEQLDRIEAECRHTWCGFAHYIRVQAEESAGVKHAAAIRHDHQVGVHWRAICRKYGISKSTVYRILGQKEPQE